MRIFVELALDILFAGVVPFIAMAMLVPALRGSAKSVTNYRGRRVIYGLGIVWVIWILAMVALGYVKAALVELVGLSGESIDILLMGLPLVAAGCVFGLIDDSYGDSSSKGFKGHVKAMMHGRLTTGGLKLLGVGFASLLTAIAIASHKNVTWGVAYIIIATCVMALSANLLNLLDLRPGRAIKSYVFLVVLALIGYMIAHPRWPYVTTASLALLVLLPLVAIWRYDVHEVGMLGDMGANAMGAIAGFLFAWALPTWALVIVAVALFALNLASEKVSFSRVIAETPFLKAIDDLGRGGNGSDKPGESKDSKSNKPKDPKPSLSERLVEKAASKQESKPTSTEASPRQRSKTAARSWARPTPITVEKKAPELESEQEAEKAPKKPGIFDDIEW